jgi:hypothetical protein
MNKEFVLYEEAVALKELGFDERCFTRYYESGKLADNLSYLYHNYFGQVNAPLYQQAFRWFRDKGFAINIYSAGNDNKDWYYLIKKGTITTSDVIFKTYEEAELACLKNLIEIIKLEVGG